MRQAAVGVMGHVDHGKTALVGALTGRETDRLPEERARGMSIALGFALLREGDRSVDLIDMPGHERFVRTMVSGATGIGAFLLVVDAREGPRAQTREHLDIVRLLGVERGIVAIARADLANADDLTATRSAIGRLLTERDLPELPTIVTSVIRGTGIAELSGHLLTLAEQPAEGDDRGAAFLPVDRAFALPGFGAIVTGTLRGGRLAVGDELELLPRGHRLRVRGLGQHGEKAAGVAPGRRVAVNLRGIERSALRRGMVLATPGLVCPAERLDIEIRLLADVRPLAQGARLNLLVGTSEAPVRLRLLDRDVLEPGCTALAQLQSGAPLPLRAHEPFILRLPSPPCTVAGGVVLDPWAQRRRRHDERAGRELALLATRDPAAITAGLLKAAGWQGVPLASLARRLGSSIAWARGRVATVGGRVGGETAIAVDAAQSLRPAILAALRELTGLAPPGCGVAMSDLRASLSPPPDAGLLEPLLQEMHEARRLRLAAGELHLPGPPRPLDQQLLAVADQLAELYRESGLQPPDPDVVIAGGALRARAFRQLLRQGRLVRTVDAVQKREVFFHRDAVADAHHRLTEHFGDGPGFLVGEAGRVLGISRRFAIPLLEHLDARGLTRRRADRRIVHESTSCAAGRR